MGDFTFYGDESHGDADAYGVAGYLASVEQWKGFIKDWQEFAKEEGFTVLHKRLLEHNVKGSEFEWPELSREEKAEKKQRINTRACEIILKYTAAGAGMAVQKSEWQSQVANSKWANHLGKSFYAAGMFGCLNMVRAVFEKKRKVGMIRYVFEAGAVGEGEAKNILSEIRGDPNLRGKYCMAGYSFEDKIDPAFIPLQAADFLAYEGYRQIDNQILGKGLKLTSDGRLIKPRGALRCLLRADDPRYQNVHPNDLPVPHYGAWLHRASIRNLLGEIDVAFPEGPDTTQRLAQPRKTFK